jgi:hypothetical protein
MRPQLSFSADIPLRDSILDYVVQARRPFDELRDLLCQLAGLSILVSAAKRSRSVVDNPVTPAARERLRHTREQILNLPDAHVFGHHRKHLLGAADRLGEVAMAIGEAVALSSAKPFPLEALKRAWSELHSASLTLPGFSVVDLKKSCGCAQGHRGVLTCSPTYRSQ